jgi:hypothetical protein
LGTSSPAGLLDLAGTKTVASHIGQLNIRDTASFATGVGGSVYFFGKYRNLGDYVPTGFINTRKDNSTEGNYSFSMGFGTIANGSPISEKMTLTSGGSLGIGSTAPAANLDVLVNSASDSEIRVRNNVDGLILATQADGTQLIRSVFNRGLIFGTGTSNANATFKEAFRVDGSQRLLVGTSTSRQVTIGQSAGWDPRVQVTKTGTDGGNIAAYSWSTYNTSTGGGQGIGPDIVLARSNSNTEGTHVALTTSQLLGRITFNGSNGSAFAAGAYIAATSDDAWASGDHPTRLVFSTTADSASSPTEAWRINNQGSLIKTNSTSSEAIADNVTTTILTVGVW